MELGGTHERYWHGGVQGKGCKHLGCSAAFRSCLLGGDAPEASDRRRLPPRPRGSDSASESAAAERLLRLVSRSLATDAVSASEYSEATEAWERGIFALFVTPPPAPVDLRGEMGPGEAMSKGGRTPDASSHAFERSHGRSLTTRGAMFQKYYKACFGSIGRS